MEHLEGPQGDGALAKALSALGHPVRIALLRHLRTPRVLKEIRLTTPGDGDGRPLARQTVKEHLDKLLEVGVVAARDTDRGYGPTTEYVCDQQALYAVKVGFDALAAIRPSEQSPGQTLTGTSTGSAATNLNGRPALVLVKGVDIGRTFLLRPTANDGQTWIVGRRRDADIPLDFDPFVSAENSVIEWTGTEHVVRDLEASRNGTHVNFRALDPSERHVLETGDLIGVGRSILLFRGQQ